MCRSVAPPYNSGMSTIAPVTSSLDTAGRFLEHLSTRNFDGLATTLEPDAHLSALLPHGLAEWQGREAVADAFTMFFGDMEEYTVVEATCGQVGNRLQMRWRIHVRADRLGPDDHVVEQQCYADAGPTGCIQFMALVCSGFCKEHTDV